MLHVDDKIGSILPILADEMFDVGRKGYGYKSNMVDLGGMLALSQS